MGLITEAEYRDNMLIRTVASKPEPAFETPGEMTSVWARPWGCSNDVG